MTRSVIIAADSAVAADGAVAANAAVAVITTFSVH